MKCFTRREMREMFEKDICASVNAWLLRGDGAAVFENADLGSTGLGHRKLVSFGKEPSAFIVSSEDELPSTLPDINGAINWRYQLIGIYKGEPL